MTDRTLIFGPDPIFSKSSTMIENIDHEVLALCEQLKNLLYEQNAVGVAAPMIGVLKREIASDLQENEKNNLILMINPAVKNRSSEMQTFDEASICFSGISAKIERPKSIKVEYMDLDGNQVLLDVDGWLATVVQHEMDYLEGKIFLDYLSPMKRKILLKKVKKQRNKKN